MSAQHGIAIHREMLSFISTSSHVSLSRLVIKIRLKLYFLKGEYSKYLSQQMCTDATVIRGQYPYDTMLFALKNQRITTIAKD